MLSLIITGAYCAPAPVYNNEDFKRISTATARILTLNHYSRAQMSADLSARVFDGFIDTIDPARLFFSEEDIRQFESERESIGFKLQYGEYQFAFSVYEIFKKNFHEYKDFCEKQLVKGVDFNSNETFITDRSKMPRCSTRTDLKKLWKQKLTNDLLIYRLMERAENDAAAKKAASGKKSGTAAKKEKINRPSPEKRVRQRLRDLANDIDKKDNIDILSLLLNSLAQAYGAHSNYHPPKLSEDFEIHMTLSLTGIGATLTSENGYIKIVELVPGGPAEKSGKLKIDDRLISVTQEDGTSTDLIDMPVSKAVRFIRGPKNTKLTLDVLSGDGGAVHKVTIVREKIDLVDSAAKGEVKVIDTKNGKVKVGLLTLPSFYMDFEGVARGNADARRASADVRKILDKFRAEKVQSVLIDLRRNGGGSLPDAIIMTGLFMKGGPVVQIRTIRQTGLESDEDPAIMYEGPLVILTSKMSASAAEIFTAALRDTDRAVVVGDSRTFGKGTVLSVDSLDRYNSWFGSKRPPAGTLTFETAMFYRSSGGSVQQLGISPDIKLPSLTEEMKIGEIYMDNHLPWDSIPAVPAEKFHIDLTSKINILRKLSEERRNNSAQFKLFLQQINIYKQLRDRKAVSLNEQERYQQYLKEKEVAEEVEKLLNDTAEKNKTKKNAPDFVLDEALNIAADFYSISQIKICDGE